MPKNERENKQVIKVKMDLGMQRNWLSSEIIHLRESGFLLS